MWPFWLDQVDSRHTKFFFKALCGRGDSCNCEEFYVARSELMVLGDESRKRLFDARNAKVQSMNESDALEFDKAFTESWSNFEDYRDPKYLLSLLYRLYHSHLST